MNSDSSVPGRRLVLKRPDRSVPAGRALPPGEDQRPTRHDHRHLSVHPRGDGHFDGLVHPRSVSAIAPFQGAQTESESLLPSPPMVLEKLGSSLPMALRKIPSASYTDE